MAITFNDFLCGTGARRYALDHRSLNEKTELAADAVRSADLVLMGAGAGMSAAAGADYGTKAFKEHFAEFRARYGEDNDYMQDMYSAGFYPYPTQETFWGYWSKYALLQGFDLDVTPLHRLLLSCFEGKDSFLLSTNVDGQFEKAGYPKEQIFCTQGDYFHIQCAKACHDRVYNAEELFRKMDAQRVNCAVPTELVPKCPVCGGRMTMNLRSDSYFVEDEAWHEAEKRFSSYVTRALNGIKEGKKLVLVELGVGFNTPVIIRFPFERLLLGSEQVTLLRFNMNEAAIPAGTEERAVGFNGDMAESIACLAAALGKEARL